MPTTVNGIGTRYYGKRNIQSRPGTCPHCRRSVNLVSYDTRLWFVVVFIPVIPLGRKRIIDSCPACRRHFVADLEKWETARQLETSGAMDKFRSNPTPETAIEAHRQLVGFHQLDEAATFQKTICEQFPDNAKIQIYLGTAWRQLGRIKESEPFFERALELRPDMPEARAGVAQTHIRAKRLEEAHALLEFMDKPGAGQLYPLAPLEQLAIAYQETGQHLKALPLFKRLLEELPALADNPKFRNLVAKSETGQEPSILPKVKFSWRRLFKGGGAANNKYNLIVAGGAVGLICLGFILSNFYVKHHRTLYVANGTGKDVTLDISGIGQINARRGLTEVTVPEGHYVVKMSGPVQDEAQFDIGSSYFSRWGGKPAWLLNPGGRALLVLTRAIYSKAPMPGTFTYLYGSSFEALGEVEYPFTQLPASLTVDSGSDQKVVRALDFFKGKPLNAYYALLEKKNGQALSLAEWDLRVNPADKEMLRAYLNGASTTNDIFRVRDFLHAGVTNSKVPIEWHRVYQDVSIYGDGAKTLLVEYTELLKANPADSDLLYLCGRACEDQAQGREYFHKALQVNADNPYPIYALAYDSVLRGEWQAAKPELDKIVKLSPDDRDFRDAWKTACVAVGKPDEAEAKYLGLLKTDPLDWESTQSLCDVLAAEGKRAEADAAIAGMLRAFKTKSPSSVEEVRVAVQGHYLYAIGDFGELEKLARDDHSPAGKYPLFQSLIEQGRPEDAAKVLPMAELKNPEILLAGCLAFRLANKPAEANAWKAECVKSLREEGGRHNAPIIAVLTDKADSPWKDLDEIVTPPLFKAVILEELALTHPQVRDQLTRTAQLLTVERIFPYHLLERATGTVPAH